MIFYVKYGVSPKKQVMSLDMRKCRHCKCNSETKNTITYTSRQTAYATFYRTPISAYPSFGPDIPCAWSACHARSGRDHPSLPFSSAHPYHGQNVCEPKREHNQLTLLVELESATHGSTTTLFACGL